MSVESVVLLVIRIVTENNVDSGSGVSTQQSQAVSPSQAVYRLALLNISQHNILKRHTGPPSQAAYRLALLKILQHNILEKHIGPPSHTVYRLALLKLHSIIFGESQIKGRFIDNLQF